MSILLPDLRGGGAERVSLDLAHAFSACGQEVELVLMREAGEFLPEARKNFRVISLNAPRARNAPLPLARYLRSQRPDALIANMWPLTSAAVIARVLAQSDCKLLLVDHGTLSRAYASWGKLHNLMMRASMMATYPLADHVAAVSQGAATDLARLARLPDGAVTILHNPIPRRPPPAESSMAEADSLWGCARSERILTVGSLKDAKNHPLLIRAFSKLSRPDARLMIVGQGVNESGLRSLARDLGLGDRVIFAGFHADPSPFYATADLFALSSDHEGLPTVLIEALSFGVPVVSTDCPSGPAEILENGRWGRLVPVGDAEALAHAMDAALSAPADHAALKQRAADFAPEIAARRYLDLLGLA